jgi:Carboxypeptidase regulatory-like domain
VSGTGCWSCCSWTLVSLKPVLLGPDQLSGDVFTKGTNGEPAVLPGVRIVLLGPITKETESDAQGAFAIDRLPPGTYEIEANAPELSGGLAVEVAP